ncbi:MAG TPA: hypothetical protein DEF41_14270 [Desulfovibrio sp.]|uniref:Uncharacterized protein n=1 Tax=Nitratidesulfovibrio vulgaris (strain ATCC 29579 / DSM 644 / CCUG 34227 / NCIMB 8303 / VKM B-1760 / Hildenborough) TaxID=882 RepID=Q729I4_NITV2|nr:hypothetical protein DVU_2366 [Nitratidesulfovibrio vulgaris str. Hildenborough]HBW17248.1 hypothetical protein [Desulfovibrio sp.]
MPAPATDRPCPQDMRSKLAAFCIPSRHRADALFRSLAMTHAA